MRGPGPQSKAQGKKLKRGAALQLMTYPRAGTKRVLVRAAKESGRKLSNFVILAAVEKAARIRGQSIKKLIPEAEYEQLISQSA